jgi:hypothetical protein
MRDFSQLGSAQTLQLVVRQASYFNNDWCRMAAKATVCCQLNRAYSMSSNNVLKAVLTRHGKLFQQSSRKTMMLCPCTGNCTVATLHATSKSSITCNEHLSSVEH